MEVCDVARWRVSLSAADASRQTTRPAQKRKERNAGAYR